jgi:putative DNA primase/helicase
MAKIVRRIETGPSYRDQLQEYKDRVRETFRIDHAIETIAGVRFSSRAGMTSRMACCPFHTEKSPSFSVNPEAGYYRCFGNGCGAKGDVFTFIMDYHGVSFMEALHTAGRAVGLEPPTPDGKPVRTGKTAGPAAPKRAAFLERKTHPADLAPHGLTPVPGRARRPRPDAWAKGWHEGNVTTPAATRVYKPRMVHEYRNTSGQLLLSILRVERREKRENGKVDKYFMPFRISELPEGAPNEVLIDRETRQGWLIRGVPQGRLRPVYGMERVPEWGDAGGVNILVVEGEKTADAARRLLCSTAERTDWVVFSPLGGGNSALHADWGDLAAALQGGGPRPLNVVVWPDADTPTVMRNTGEEIDRQAGYAKDIVNGMAYAFAHADIPLDQVRFSRVSPISGVTSGWDLADAETEGWSGEAVLAKIDTAHFVVQPDSAFLDVELSAREEADAPAPFEHDDSAVDVDAYDALIREVGEQEEDEMSQRHDQARTPGPLTGADLLPEPDPLPYTIETAPADGEAQVRDVAAEDVLVPNPDGGDDDLIHDPKVVQMLDNRHFRCLGYMNGVSFFMSLHSGQIFSLTPALMRWNYLFHLAPAEFWLYHFPAPADRNGVIKTDWESVVNAIIKATNRVGQYDPENQVGQGTWMDGERIVFNSGRGLWVEGEGPVRIQDFKGKKNYIVGRFCGMPDFDNPLPADSAEVWELLSILKALHWAPEGRSVSVMNMFGWLAIGPICGVLPWRPHLYLSGERGVGKSWIINNIINRMFRDYGVNVKADSTESGLRNLLNGHAFPLIFDEAEGETVEDRQRMGKIIRLARHSATPGDSIVAQGVSGGGGQRQYAIASTFLMCSITPQLTASADFTRFGKAHLMGGLSHYDFVEQIKGPAERLLTVEFSRRFMARMILRAQDMREVSIKMQQGLSSYNMEQRLIDVYGTYLAGAWLLLRDDVPDSGAAAMKWVRDTFNMVDDLMAQVREVSEDKDHVRLFRTLLSTDIRVESLSTGARNYTLSELIEIVTGRYQFEDGVRPEEAVRSLAKIGIRVSAANKPVDAKGGADSIVIHKNSPHIERFLDKTPYAKSFADVMCQGRGVRKGGDKDVVRFYGLGSSRIVIVPLENLSLGEDVTNGGTEQAWDE